MKNFVQGWLVTAAIQVYLHGDMAIDVIYNSLMVAINHPYPV